MEEQMRPMFSFNIHISNVEGYFSARLKSLDKAPVFKYLHKAKCKEMNSWIVGKLWQEQAESCTQLELWSQGCSYL